MIDQLQHQITQILDKFGGKPSALLPVLQELGKIHSYLSPEIINEVSRAFNLSQTEVYSVASFYHFLNVKPVGKYVVRLCATISCELAGKDRIIHALEAELGISMGQTTSDGLYTLTFANCMGMCDQGPAMLVNDDLYANLTPSKAVEIVRSYQ